MGTHGGAARRAFSLPGIALNERQIMNGVDLFAAIPDGSAALVNLDPQYRSVLDKMRYGNEGARQKRRAALPQMSDDDVAFFVEEAERALRPSGHVLFWTDKFSVGEGHHVRFYRRARRLRVVDFFAWNTLRFGMGRRSRGCTEYLVVLQKEPIRAKGVWKDPRIRDCWAESTDRSLHVHAKPVALLDRLVRATTKRGDLVVDPCAGSYGLLEVCRASARVYAGCDLR